MNYSCTIFSFFRIVLICLLPHLVFSQWSFVSTIDTNNYYGVFTNAINKVNIPAERGTIYTSSNGAASLQAQGNFPYGYITDIDFFNEQVGFASGGCWFPTPDCPNSVFYKTENGGNNWNLVHSHLQGWPITKLSAPSQDTLFAVSDYVGCIVSYDSGATWETLLATVSNNYGNPVDIQFLNTKKGYLLAVKYNGNALPSTNNLLKTEDGGLTWSLLYSKQENNAQFFQFLNDGHGWLDGPDNSYYYTTNGGSTWENVSLFGADESIGQIQMLSKDQGYLFTQQQSPEEKSTIYRTLNGGFSWDKDLELDVASLGFIHFSDMQNGYAIFNFRDLWRRQGTSATEDMVNKETFIIQPNPANAHFSLTGNTIAYGWNISLFDASGKNIWRQPLKGSDSSYDTSQLPNGFYIVQVTDTNERLIYKEKMIVVH